uniref:Uncharacterized protein n=1 Tax=Arion vulgaris TaxID=1028688 RepID=A0A0B7BKW6_9EUPU
MGSHPGNTLKCLPAEHMTIPVLWVGCTAQYKQTTLGELDKVQNPDASCHDRSNEINTTITLRSAR